MVDSEVEVPGAVAVEPDELADRTDRGRRTPDLELTPSTPDVGFVHRRLAGMRHLPLGQHRSDPAGSFASPAGTGAGYYQEWDANTGRVRRGGETGGGIPVSLHPYQATVLVLTDEVPDGDPDREDRRPLDWRRLAADWQVGFAGEPLRPVELPHVWEEQPGRRHFSGSARYRTVVELAGWTRRRRWCSISARAASSPRRRSEREGLVGASFRARLASPVGEVAAITVNGVDCGVLWAPPYRLDISAAVRAGRNKIEITVFNTGGQRLGGRRGHPAAGRRSEAAVRPPVPDAGPRPGHGHGAVGAAPAAVDRDRLSPATSLIVGGRAGPPGRPKPPACIAASKAWPPGRKEPR